MDKYPLVIISPHTDPPISLDIDPGISVHTDPPVSVDIDPDLSVQTDPLVSEHTDPPFPGSFLISFELDIPEHIDPLIPE